MEGRTRAVLDRGPSANNSGTRRISSSAMEVFADGVATGSGTANSATGNGLGHFAGTSAGFGAAVVFATALAGDLAGGRDGFAAFLALVGFGADRTRPAGTRAGLAGFTAITAGTWVGLIGADFATTEAGIGSGDWAAAFGFGAATSLAGTFFATGLGITGAGGAGAILETLVGAAAFLNGAAATAGAGTDWATAETPLSATGFVLPTVGALGAGFGAATGNFAAGTFGNGATLGWGGTLAVACVDALAGFTAAGGTGFDTGGRTLAGVAAGACGFRAKGGSGAGGDGRFRDFGVMGRNPTDGGGSCRPAELAARPAGLQPVSRARFGVWVGVSAIAGLLVGRMKNRHAVAAHFAGTWDEARVQRWAEGVRARLEAPAVTLGILFMTPDFFEVAAEVLEVIRLHARVPLLAGCSSQSLIVNGEEWENQPGLALQLFHLPDGDIRAVHLDQAAMQDVSEPAEWHGLTGLAPAATKGWIIFADPFNVDGESWLREWNAAYPGIACVGGLASGIFEEQRTQVYLNGEVFEEGIVAVSVSGGVKLECVISQGCTPIGAPWTVTRADRNFILQIANRPAYSVLVDTFNGLTDAEKEKSQGNLFVGFASSEYRDEFQRGDFLVRNLLGADPSNGVIAVGAMPRTGQTIQFHRRDAASATEDMNACLALARERLADATVYGGVVGICNGRGKRLFGKPNHDAGLIQEQLGPLPLAGFFCNGELGPVGPKNFLHGYTASLALLVKTGDR